MNLLILLLGALSAIIVFTTVKTYILRVEKNWGIIAISLSIGIVNVFIGQTIFMLLRIDPRQTEGLIRYGAPLFEPIVALVWLGILMTRRSLPSYRHGILFGMAVGLGYSIAENSVFLLNTELDFALQGYMRFMVTDSVRAVSMGMMGFFLAEARPWRTNSQRLRVVIGIVVAISWQLAFNVLTTLITGTALLFISIIFIVGGAATMLFVIRSAQMRLEKSRADKLLDVVIPIGVGLTSAQDFNQLLEDLLRQAQAFCQASTGILYLRTDEGRLRQVCASHAGQVWGGTSDQAITAEPLPLDSAATDLPPAAHVARTGGALNLPDVAAAIGFTFSDNYGALSRGGAAQTSLTLPLSSSAGEVVGVLQLYDARDEATGIVIPFDENLQELTTSFAALAAAALEGYLREASLRLELRELRIEIDRAKVKEEVKEIEESEFFQDLRAQARSMRQRKHRQSGGGDS